QAVAVPVLAVTADAAGLIDLASEREEILASRDVHDRHADRLRLEHFSPRTSVGAELLDVADQTDQLLRGEYQGDPLERGRLVAEAVEVDDGRAVERPPAVGRRRDERDALGVRVERNRRLRLHREVLLELVPWRERRPRVGASQGKAHPRVEPLEA